MAVNHEIDRGLNTEKEKLAESLTPANRLLLYNSMWTIPGGAGAPDEIVVPLMRESALKHWQKTMPLHLLTIIHTDENPDYEDIQRPTQRQAAGSIHAEKSCGMSGGNSETVRQQMRKNVASFFSEMPEIPYTTVHQVEVQLGNGLDEYQRLKLTYLVDKEGSNQLDHQIRPSLTPLNYEEFNEFLVGLQKKGSVAGIGCVDSRQGLVLPSPEASKYAIRPDEINPELRTDWQGVGHTEPFGVMIVDSDPVATRLARLAITTSWAIVRSRQANSFFSPSYPFILKVPLTFLMGEKGKWLGETLAGLVTSMNTHGYRKILPYGQLRQRYRVYKRFADGSVKELERRGGFDIYHSEEALVSEFFERHKAGLLIDSHNPVATKSWWFPGTGRSFGRVIE